MDGLLLQAATALRAADVPVGSRELLDASRALLAISWDDEATVREVLAATLVKTAEHRERFLALWDELLRHQVLRAALDAQRSLSGTGADGEVTTPASAASLARPAAVREREKATAARPAARGWQTAWTSTSSPAWCNPRSARALGRRRIGDARSRAARHRCRTPAGIGASSASTCNGSGGCSVSHAAATGSNASPTRRCAPSRSCCGRSSRSSARCARRPATAACPGAAGRDLAIGQSPDEAAVLKRSTPPATARGRGPQPPWPALGADRSAPHHPLLSADGRRADRDRAAAGAPAPPAALALCDVSTSVSGSAVFFLSVVSPSRTPSVACAPGRSSRSPTR